MAVVVAGAVAAVVGVADTAREGVLSVHPAKTMHPIRRRIIHTPKQELVLSIRIRLF
jgi:hypothetical protein